MKKSFLSSPRKTPRLRIREVNFYPQEGVTYGVYIKQGNREYEESFTQLKTPFVIDLTTEKGSQTVQGIKK